ncbi:MAG: hypothetical protein EXS48_03635 [Candidatus Staskawiczbacteria bacterium]|nr:hypothetical protein [Candidatus Staskawiczbacteria bacterium]
MVDSKLLDYIKQKVDSGSLPEEIKAVLIKAGWSEAEIQEGFAQAHPVTPVTPPSNQPGKMTDRQPVFQNTKPSPKFSLKIIVLILAIIFVVALIGAGAYFYFMGANTTQNKVADISPIVEETNNIMSDWKTYSSAEYGFEIKYPPEWKFDANAQGEPRFSFYKEGVAPLMGGHANVTQVSIFPKGLGTEGPAGENRTVDKDLMGASEKAIYEYYLTNNQPRGYDINYNNPPQNWNEAGFVWAGVKVENMTTEQISPPDGIGYPKTKISGNINSEDLSMILQILSTFKFTDWTMYTDEEYGISFQYPSTWVIEKQFSPLSPQSDKRDGFNLYFENDKPNSINIDHTEMDCDTLIGRGFHCSMIGGHIVRTNSRDAKVLEIFNKILSTFKFTK